ncbi:glutamate ABC transporter substrate-binding protein [Nonomuraea turkmeniaca]|uniref:Glutamate ABC transporter substrate-binding protein n=1 Tax=Nonomuraea turkmeniaca TaxID=103838 RepID=A0A5S4FQ42_9ACTN|nr:glutamate ABC transporter substrate-binding protein [Nonomuraea turkmeniaca]TMR11355.1 glutamate ABC transporter substrate-binding protein [Nonomuraea turkmeniaca]
MLGFAGAAMVMVVALAACDGGGAYSTVVEKIRGAKTVVVGTKWDQPSLGLKNGPGDPVGFDVDVARYIVKALAGGEDVRITWRESPSSIREALLQNGTVDMIVATYAITAARKPHVTFAGPYVLVQQDTMVRADETRIKKATDLRGKRICLAEGSNSYRRIVDPPPDGKLDLRAVLVPARNYSECVRKLADGQLDAISTQNLILAGFAEAEPGRFRLLNDPILDEKWAVGLKKGDIATCEAINQAIAEMWRDGTATRLLHKWFGKTGLKLPTSLPSPEGCP